MRRLQVITNVNGGTASLTALVPFNLNGLYYANPNPGSAQTLTVTCVVRPPPPLSRGLCSPCAASCPSRRRAQTLLSLGASECQVPSTLALRSFCTVGQLKCRRPAHLNVYGLEM